MSKEDLVVLAVDDDMINLKLLKSMLMKSGNVKEVIEAKNGSDAIGVLKSRNDIDLILLDIIMPVMGGIEMLKVVRADDNLRQLPIIVLTTDETKKSEALEFGANGFLMKPIRNNDLIQKIATVIV
ncbi:protein containing response regulator receiver domain [Sulfurimonas gotlandica GD1]|jgi:CheY-like chemotaxis protein|uniref:Protein containing response regulator receiver domain n=1 Tax=Sulfurimonas gotlandica (strain DSM 19862 / JCM 16533 / GD1) TaxID=929558 RepID=B6BM84_SULGG|nr:response regulator [Sulfurimonas gotlandica]EDZ61745.1 response regulator receiver domain protein [Sulfurimonas gotlandica GD1]EHP29338.1 protein containing response regulator receiver domain [Sulfurimonas gotlandica GD1]